MHAHYSIYEQFYYWCGWICKSTQGCCSKECIFNPSKCTWNEDVKKIRTKRATSGGLKQPFSQVEKNSNSCI